VLPVGAQPVTALPARAQPVGALPVWAQQIQQEPVQPEPVRQEPSVRSPDRDAWAAAWRSLVLPGWGQRLQGKRTYAGILTAVEVAFWGGVVGWNAYEDWRLEDSRRWAALHAGALLADKDRIYFQNLAFFPDLDTYNAVQRSGLGDPSLSYPAGAGYEWQWDSQASWKRYRRLRTLARRADNFATLAVGGIVAVRLVGAVSALIAGRRASLDATTAAPDRPVNSRWQPWWRFEPDGRLTAGLRWNWRW
jgi:hypothetical protein